MASLEKRAGLAIVYISLPGAPRSPLTRNSSVKKEEQVASRKIYTDLLACSGNSEKFSVEEVGRKMARTIRPKHLVVFQE